jgi:hypothetical protein
LRPKTAHWSAVIVALILVVAVALIEVHPWADGHRPTRGNAIRAPDPGMAAALAALGTAAQHVPKSSRLWSRGTTRVLSHAVGGDTWKLALSAATTRVCWLLLVPRTTNEGTCGRAADVRKRQLLIYMGAQPDARRPSHWRGLVVYGVVSHAVRSLTVTLSDCSTLAVRLSARPLFWAFVPTQQLRQNAVPIGFVMQLLGGRQLRGRLTAFATPRSKTAASNARC